MTAERFKELTLALSLLIGLAASAHAQPERAEAEASEESEQPPRTSIVRDVTTSGAPARRRRDAPLELNTAIDGEDLVWWPWVASFGLASGGLAIDSLVDSSEPRWTAVGSLDLSVTEGLLLGPAGRERAATISDVMLISSVLATYLDAALWRHDDRSNSRTSYRLIMLDSMVFSMNTALVALFKGTIQRKRPSGELSALQALASLRRRRCFASSPQSTTCPMFSLAPSSGSFWATSSLCMSFPGAYR